jgi:hypothetical protein
MWDMSNALGEKDDEKIHVEYLAPGTYLQSSNLVLRRGVDDFLVPNIRVFIECAHILEVSQKFGHGHNFLSVAETL